MVGAYRGDGAIQHAFPHGVHIALASHRGIDLGVGPGGRLVVQEEVVRAGLDVNGRRAGRAPMAPRLVQRFAAAQVHDIDRGARLRREVAHAVHVLGFQEVRTLLVPGLQIIAAGRAQRVSQHGNDLDVFAVHAHDRAGDGGRGAQGRIQQAVVDVGEALGQARGAFVHHVELVGRHAETARNFLKRFHMQIAGDTEMEAEVHAALRQRAVAHLFK
ncbi:hypothetical protein D3C85_976130 [compost metagenome]